MNSKDILTIKVVKNDVSIEVHDSVATEEPLEIILGYGEVSHRKRKSISVTMRTPTGHDFELALGFLFSEGIITNPNEVASVRYIAPSEENDESKTNTVLIDLKAGVQVQIQQLERHFYTTSSCGVCGKASIELLQNALFLYPNESDFVIDCHFLYSLPQKLLNAQSVFDKTGAIHAAALFDLKGNVICLREDVGRHNAMDKLIGWAIQRNMIPLQKQVLLLSGRISFELVQKAATAGIKCIAAIGAPSTLAINLAAEHNVTLIGFLRENRFNIYNAPQRIDLQKNLS